MKSLSNYRDFITKEQRKHPTLSFIERQFRDTRKVWYYLLATIVLFIIIDLAL